jgi:MFS family permease
MVACFDHNPSPQVDRGIVAILALIAVAGVARTFGWAARTAFVPQLVPGAALANAITWNSSTFQAAAAVGPALGGLMIAKAGFPAVYLADAFCALAFLGLLLPVRLHRAAASRGPSAGAATRRDLLSGLRFVFRTKLVLATITLDLFAVLFGGATALLPVFADRLHVGSVGLGCLRAADSVGSIAMGILIAHLPPMKQAGKTILVAIAAYGLGIIGFGLSPYYWLSLLMLFFTGLCDSVNVVIRHTLVQVMTPDSLRGRVSAVNNIFIGSSNELGAFESGLTAGLFGPVASVIGGGVGTICVVALVAWLAPELRRFRSFEPPKIGS